MVERRGGVVQMIYEQALIERCQELDIDEHGLVSITNFIKAAMYHVSLPGTLPADKHVAINTAIRRATNRILCQGRHGDSRSMGRLLSRGAIRLRDAIQSDTAILPNRKLGVWRAQVTEEHQEPVREVERRWAAEPDLLPETVVRWLLQAPSAIILRSEERTISNDHKHRGSAAERYAAAGIELEFVNLGTADFFSGGVRRTRPGQYFVERKPFA